MIDSWMGGEQGFNDQRNQFSQSEITEDGEEQWRTLGGRGG